MRRSPPPTDAAPSVAKRTLRYREAQEHMLRRLGQAVVLQWDALPDELQDLLIDQAVAVDDRDERVVEAKDVEGFVRTVQSTAFTKTKAAEES